MTTKREHLHHPHEPESSIQSLSTHRPKTITNSMTLSGSLAYNIWIFIFFQKRKKNNDEGPIETHIYSSKTDLLLSIRYSYCLRNGAYGRPANSLQTSVMHFSAQPQLPHKPIVLERRAWPPLSLALPFSSSFFDSEEQSGRRCSRRAVEGESAISPSLPCS